MPTVPSVNLVDFECTVRDIYKENKTLSSVFSAHKRNHEFAKDPLHNSGEVVAVGSGWAARRLFAVNSPSIGKKNDATERPSPADHRPQGVMQRVPKYLRNKFIGHIHAELIEKAIEWNPMLRNLTTPMGDQKIMFLANIFVLETAINTYVGEDGKHKVFDSETDLMYPPD